MLPKFRGNEGAWARCAAAAFSPAVWVPREEGTTGVPSAWKGSPLHVSHLFVELFLTSMFLDEFAPNNKMGPVLLTSIISR